MNRARRRAAPAAVLFVCLLLAACAGDRNGKEAGPDEGATVVILHGLGRDESAMWLLGKRIARAGYRVVQVGYKSLSSPPEEILAAVRRQIDACCKESPQPVHFVGHSLGGLMIRAYLADHEVRTLGRVVMIATPNDGTPLVDAYSGRWWLDLAGPTAKRLGTSPGSFPKSLPVPNYPVGIIAGRASNGLTSRRIPGEDDGLVAVESAKLQGMTDFIAVDSSHFFLRYSAEVARQTIAFLQSGHFLKQADD